MPRRTRVPITDALSSAQTGRTTARHDWIDRLIDNLIRVLPDHQAALELMRIDLRTGSEAYAAKLNEADAALINRVSAMLLNEQLSRTEHDESLQAILDNRTAAIDRIATILVTQARHEQIVQSIVARLDASDRV